MKGGFLPFTHSILIVTIAVSAFAWKNGRIFESLLFSTRSIRKNREFHRFLTSMFLHTDFGHLLFNMFTLYSFAGYMEPRIGSVSLFVIYLFTGMTGDLLALYMKRHEIDYRAVGASGGVLGIIFASIFLFPGGSVYIYFVPIPVPDWLYAILFIAISSYGTGRSHSSIGHEAHLGGALGGMLCALLIYPKIIVENTALFFGIPLLLIVSLIVVKRFQNR